MPDAASAPGAIPTMDFLLYRDLKGARVMLLRSAKKVWIFRHAFYRSIEITAK
jgi:hypothetical protein